MTRRSEQLARIEATLGDLKDAATVLAARHAEANAVLTALDTRISDLAEAVRNVLAARTQGHDRLAEAVEAVTGRVAEVHSLLTSAPKPAAGKTAGTDWKKL
jgi:hypothetical protein